MEQGKTENEKRYNFIKKTQEIILQYERLNLPKNKYYDVTLLLNASVGLLFIAQQKYNSSFTSQRCKLEFNNWSDVANDVTICKKYNYDKKIIEDEPVTINSVCRHIRNSIAHCNFVMDTNKTDKVVAIIFDDYKNKSKVDHTFHLRISVENFKELAMAISNFILKKMDNDKKTQKNKKKKK